MFPHSTFSPASTGIKTEEDFQMEDPGEEFQEAVEVKVKEEPEEENEENPQQSLSQFLNENQIRKRQFQPGNAPNEDDCTHVAFEPAEAKLQFYLKQEWLTEKEQDFITVNTNTTETETSSPIPFQIPIPAPAPEQMCSFCDKKFPTLQKLKFHMKYHQVKKYKCTVCELKTTTLSALETHQLVHTGEKPWKCSEPNCQMAFTQKQNLQRHKFTVHGRNEGNFKLFRCQLCPFKATRQFSLTNHLNFVHRGIKKFGCPRCECKFAARGNLNRHIQFVHMKLRPFKCPQSGCEYAAKDGGNFRRHQRLVHKTNPEQAKAIWKNLSPSHSAVQIANTEPKSQPEVPIKNSQFSTQNVHQQQESPKPELRCFTLFYHCDNCDFFTKTPKQVASHLYKNHNLPRVILKKLKSSSGLKTRQRNEEESKIIVDQNSGLDIRASRSREHVNVVHKKLKSWTCHFKGCGHKTTSRWNLKEHTDFVHHNMKKFSCDFCSLEMTRKSNLRRHIQITHLQLRPFKCPEIGCPHKAKTKAHLEVHLQRVHSKSKSQVQAVLKHFNNKFQQQH